MTNTHKLISLQLSEPAVAVPDFPLYVEKRGIPLTSLPVATTTYAYNTI